MKVNRVVAIGASAGGIQAVLSILHRLPENFPGSILIVIHTSAESPGLLPTLLQRGSRLRVVAAEHDMPLAPGTAYVACPGRHMLVSEGKLQLTNGPYENRNRPAIDPTFRSLALEYGRGAVGVILTGYLDDGTAGLASIKRHGGKAVVQDPDDAEVPSMPLSAIRNVQVDAIVPLARIPETLISLAEQEILPGPYLTRQEKHMTKDQGSPSVYTCPDCHGTLWEVEDGKLLRFECRVGHAYSMESMVEDQNDSTERALWAALRALEESASLSRRLADRSRQIGNTLAIDRFAQRARNADEHIRVLRMLLDRVEPTVAQSQTGTRTSGI